MFLLTLDEAYEKQSYWFTVFRLQSSEGTIGNYPGIVCEMRLLSMFVRKTETHIGRLLNLVQSNTTFY